MINLLASNLIKLNHFLYYLIPFKSTITFYKKGIKDSESRIIPFKSNNKLVKKSLLKIGEKSSEFKDLLFIIKWLI